MRITELVNEQQDLNEGPIGQAIGKGVGGLAKGIGAVAGGIAGIPGAFKKGFASGKSTVSGEPQQGAPTQSAPGNPNAAPAAGSGGSFAQSLAQGAGGSAAQPSEAPPNAPASASAAPGEPAGQQAEPKPQADSASTMRDIMSKLQNLDQESKEKIANAIQQDITGAASAKPSTAPEAPAASTPKTAIDPGKDHGLGKQSDGQFIQPGQKFDTYSGEPIAPAAPAAPAASGAPAAPVAAGVPADKMSAKDQNALKAKLKAGQGIGSKTQSGFTGYVQGGGGQELAGADAQGNPVFKQKPQRESVEFFSKFLQMKI